MIGADTQKGNKNDATEALLLPPAVAERVMRIEHELTRYLVAVIIAKCLASAAPVSVHSRIVRRILAERHYHHYLSAMESFADLVIRDTHYIPKVLAKDKPAKCMAWAALSCHHIECSTEICIPASFLARLSSSFDWYLRVWLPSLDPGLAEASALVGGFLGLLEVPEVSEQEAETICETPEAAAELVEKCERLCEEGCSAHVGFDRGDRLYHELTNLKKEIRRRCLFDGERITEIDMHASFVGCVTLLYADGDERELLIEMLQTGNFYEEFWRRAQPAGVPKERVKERFMRDVVFSFRRAGNPMWEAFRRMFPRTARGLSRDRDWGTVVKVEKRVDQNGRRYTARTREGQTYVSRRLSKVESCIFWRGALMRLWHDHGIPSIPIHDCLLVRESDAETALAVVVESAERVLGFRPVVNVTDHNGARDSRESLELKSRQVSPGGFS